jgi:multidrug resistance efflux pump
MATGYADVEGGITPLYPVKLGQIKSIEARENEAVQANVPLFHMDDSHEALQLQRAENARAAAQEKLSLAEAKVQQFHKQVAAQKEGITAANCDVDLARVRLQEVEKLFKKDLERKATVDGAKILVDKAEAAVRGKQKELAALEALNPEVAVNLARKDVKDKDILVREAQLAMDKCIVRAPFAGTPLRVLINIGETLGPNPRQAAIQFCPDRPLIVRAEVEQEFADFIRNDQPTLIQNHVTGDALGHGKVVSISRWYTQRRSALFDPLQLNDVRTLECIIKLDSTVQDLRIGQRVRVQFPGSDR